MSAPTTYYVGLDLAAAQFFASIGTAPWQLVAPATEFPNTAEGFETLRTWLDAHDCTVHDTLLCMEATGVYGEALAYFLAHHGYRIAVEPPLHVKRAFKPHGPKTDAIDSQQIAEYAYRFRDQLHVWQPRAELLEQLSVLTTTRELLVKQRTAHKNSLHALHRKVVRTPKAEAAHQQLIRELDTQIKAIETEIRRLFKQDPPFQHLLNLLRSIPGVGLLLATQFLIATRGQPACADPKALAAYLGIAPLPHQSGKTIRGRTTSRHYGPPIMRKLLHLGARSICTHAAAFRTYFQRKRQAGKPKRLIYNNVSNKLVKLMCAVLVSQTPYDPNFHRSGVTALQTA
jgi:transposase